MNISTELKKKIEEHVGTEVTIIDRDTKFRFICDGCRDGSSKCCCNRGNECIILNPYDIYKLQKGLNKTSKEIIEKYTEIEPGYNSGFPMLILGVKRLFTGEEVCPFIRKKTNEQGISRRYCSVHEFKPGVCSIFPLGRVQAREGELIYILQDVNCGLKPKDTDPEITISDMVPDLDNADKAFVEYHKMLNDIIKIMKFDKLKTSVDVPQALKEKFYKEFLYKLCDFDNDKDYFEQFDKNRVKIIGYTKEMLDIFIKYDKKVKGKSADV